MNYMGTDYYGDSSVKSVVESIALEIGSLEEARALPYEVIFRVMSHTDSTNFISSINSIVELTDIVGSYSVYAEDKSFLYTMNLHMGSFGETLVEQDYLSRVPRLASLFVMYTNREGYLRNIQLIKR